jgi:hypothetical protein
MLKFPYPVFLFLSIMVGCTSGALAQDSTSFSSKVLSLPTKLFSALDKKASSLNQKLDRQTDKYLERLANKELKLKSKVWKKDSTLAKQLFPDVEGQYAKVKATSGKVSKYEQQYIGRLDTLTTSLSFLKSNTSLAGNPQLQKSLSSLKELQTKFNSTEQIKAYLRQRRQLLQEQLEKLGLAKELTSFKKQLYYYQAQVQEYKQLLEEPTKLEAKLLALAQSSAAFKDFFAKNSLLGSLFALPGGSSGSTASNISLAGLQTRASVSQSLLDRFGSGPGVAQYLSQNLQAAQGQLSALKAKAASLSSGAIGSASDGDLPDFKPNGQKTKSLLKRLELGTNVQTQKGSGYFPTSSDVGLSLGYKLNDQSIAGVGTSFKLGWGSGFNHLKLSAQGVGIRSFLDYRLKGSFYVSGGYELNYRSLITSLDALKGYDAWARSGLLGLSKRYSVSKKVKGEVKLLWDFLSYQQLPRTQPVVFRVGYSLK